MPTVLSADMPGGGSFGSAFGYQTNSDNGVGSSSSSRRPPPPRQPEPTFNPSTIGSEGFDIFEWHAAYLSCQRFFLDHGQYEPGSQAVTALLNILLPHQLPKPITSWADPELTSPSARFASAYVPPGTTPPRPEPVPLPGPPKMPNFVSLVPYVRRFVITGFDNDAILHGFFGDDYKKAIMPLRECERRNYLFVSKSGGWEKAKAQYDMDPMQSVPWMRAPKDIQGLELENAEKTWNAWHSLEEWTTNSRLPDGLGEDGPSGPRHEGGGRGRTFG